MQSEAGVKENERRKEFCDFARVKSELQQQSILLQKKLE
jgi:hypothetical protein